MKITKLLYVSFLSALFACSTNDPSNKGQSGLCLWYDHPAKIWEETLPLGNGRLGMMPDGGIDKEKLVLNDITLWSGGPQDADNPDAAKYLPEIRKLLIEGKNDLAQDLVYRTFMCKGEGSGHANGANIPFGSYEMLGNMYIDYQYSGKSKKYREYRRELSLNDAVASTSFILNGVKYTREYIADFNQDVLIISLKASQSRQLNFQIGMDRPQAYSTSLDDNGPGNITGKDGKLGVKGATEAMIIVSATTDYKDAGYESKCKALLESAINCNYADAKEKHTKVYPVLKGFALFFLNTLLLPALPDAFAEGSFNGMRARGGVEVGASWTNHRLKTARLKATADNTFKLRLPSGIDASRIHFLKDKQSTSLVISGKFADITLKKGEEIQIEFPID